MNNPFFSIIVVSLNAGKLMEITMQSILKQTFSDYEVIIKDGLSKDDTLSYVPVKDNFYIFSQRDSSIYDAMNQATEKTTGQYLIYLNCGDIFSGSEVLKEIYSQINNQTFGMVYGNYTRAGQLHRQPRKLTKAYLYRKPICHQSVFFNGELLRQKTPYNTKYHICGDYDLELRTFFADLAACHCDLCVCDYAPGGVSESKEAEKLKKQERKEILEQQFSRKDRFWGELGFRVTLPGLRKKLSSCSSVWIKKAYQKIANTVNN